MALKSKDKGLFGGKSRYGQDPEEGKRQGPSEREISEEVDVLDKDMNELRSQYELYFMGIEKVEPVIQRDGIKATIRKLVGPHIKNTALKFRIQQLKARMISLENYWERTNRQREAGTYKRDQARVSRREADLKKAELAAQKQRAAERGNVATDDLALTTGGKAPPLEGRQITGAALQAGKSAAETAGKQRGSVAREPGKPETGRPSASSAEDLTEPKLRRLYQTYVNARKRCGEKVDLRYEDMAAALRKQVPKLIKETGAKTVEFKVVIRSGRAVLKALPKHKPE